MSSTVACKGNNVVPLWAAYRLRALAGSNHHSLVRPLFTSSLLVQKPFYTKLYRKALCVCVCERERERDNIGIKNVV